MKNLTWQNPEQLFVAQELINKVKSKCCGIKVVFNRVLFVDTPVCEFPAVKHRTSGRTSEVNPVLGEVEPPPNSFALTFISDKYILYYRAIFTG